MAGLPLYPQLDEAEDELETLRIDLVKNGGSNFHSVSTFAFLLRIVRLAEQKWKFDSVEDNKLIHEAVGVPVALKNHNGGAQFKKKEEHRIAAANKIRDKKGTIRFWVDNKEENTKETGDENFITDVSRRLSSSVDALTDFPLFHGKNKAAATRLPAKVTPTTIQSKQKEGDDDSVAGEDEVPPPPPSLPNGLRRYIG